MNPGYFDCNNVSWLMPKAGVYSIFNDSMEISNEQEKCFQEIWFPRGDCKRFLSVLAMADVYMPLFKRKTEQLQLHKHIAFLPIVLSGCNQQFENGNCAGLWAMPDSIAALYGLRVDSLVDERRGGDFTTDAALKWILEMRKSGNGDYTNVLAGIEIIQSNSCRKLSPKNRELLKPFLAYTIRLFESAHATNQLNNCFDILGQFQPVIIEKPIAVQSIVDLLSIDERALRAANPVYTGEWLVPGYRRVPFVLENTCVGRFSALKSELEQKGVQQRSRK